MPEPDTAACAFGDPACPCQDGDVCHYVDDPLSETLAMTPITTAAVWRRVGYPTEGAVVAHNHGAVVNNVGHEHIGGDQPHRHRHRKVAPGEFEDEFYAE